MTEYIFWLSIIVVGLVLSRVLPAEKLSGLNQKIRERFPGILPTVLYILAAVFLFAGVYLLCLALHAPDWLSYILSGAVIGAFIGFIPLVDKRHSK